MTGRTETGIICPVCKRGLLTMRTEASGTARMVRVRGECRCGAVIDGGLVRQGTEPIDGEAAVATEAMRAWERRA